MESTLAGLWQRVKSVWSRRGDAAPGAARRRMPAMPGEMPGISIGGFPLVRTISQGAQGELHLATDPATGMPVAVKTVRIGRNGASQDRFLRESAAAAHLQHNDIVRTFAAGITGEGEERQGWIAMEWITGSDLSRYVSRPLLLPEALVLDIGARVAAALAHAHQQGVVHRDVKPSNVLVNLPANTVKITDFGCAYLAEAERSRSGLIIGSPSYMSPEQLAGAPLDGRSDLYALGVMLFQLLAGRLPFASDQLGELLADIAQRPAPRLSELRPDLPPVLSDIIARLLAKQPAQRHPDGAQLARELRLMSQMCAATGDPSGLSHKAQ